VGPTNDKQRSNLKAADSHVATLKSLAAAGLDGVGALLFADKFTDFAAAHGRLCSCARGFCIRSRGFRIA